MALKDLNAAGDLGHVISDAARHLSDQTNQYGGTSSPLVAALTAAGVSAGLDGTDPEVQSLLSQLMAKVQISDDATWAAIPGGYYTGTVLADAKGVVIPCAVVIAVMTAMQARLPSNDL